MCTQTEESCHDLKICSPASARNLLLVSFIVSVSLNSETTLVFVFRNHGHGHGRSSSSTSTSPLMPTVTSSPGTPAFSFLLFYRRGISVEATTEQWPTMEQWQVIRRRFSVAVVTLCCSHSPFPFVAGTFLRGGGSVGVGHGKFGVNLPWSSVAFGLMLPLAPFLFY